MSFEYLTAIKFELTTFDSIELTSLPYKVNDG